MAIYYVRPDGADANAGTANTAAGAFKTLTKAFSITLAAGDTIYIAPGRYGQQVTLTRSGTSGNPITVIGDVDASHFDGTIAPGHVIWTAFDVSDWTVPSAGGATANLNGQSYLTFQSISFVAGTNEAIKGTVLGSVGITFTDCTMLQGISATGVISFTGTVDVAANWLIDRCRIKTFGSGGAFQIILPSSAAAEYSSGIVIRNSIVESSSNPVIGFTESGAAAFYGGGVLVQNCTIIGPAFGTAFRTTGATPVPSGVGQHKVQNCLLLGINLSAAALGQIVDSNNLVYQSSGGYTNVTQDGNTVLNGSFAPMVHFGQDFVSGRAAPPNLTPFANGPLCGYGAAGSPPSVDLLNRPRPAGGGSLNTASDAGTATGSSATTLVDTTKSWTLNQWQATPPYFVTMTSGTCNGQRRAIISNTASPGDTLTINPAWIGTPPSAGDTYTITNNGGAPSIGALERHDTLTKEAVTVDAGFAVSAVGPHDHEFLVPVAAVGTVISIKTQWDANYGGGTKPQLVLIANGEIGVAGQAVAAAGAAGAWNTITLASFTPTAAGVVKLRLVSSAAAAGKVAWDTASVPGVNTGTFDTFFRNQPAPFLDSATGSNSTGISHARTQGGM